MREKKISYDHILYPWIELNWAWKNYRFRRGICFEKLYTDVPVKSDPFGWMDGWKVYTLPLGITGSFDKDIKITVY